MQRIASMNSILFYSILFYSILFYSCALRLFSKSRQNIFSQSKDMCRCGFELWGIYIFLNFFELFGIFPYIICRNVEKSNFQNSLNRKPCGL